jgi:putative transposase
MTRWLRRKGYRVNRKRVQRLMRQMGLEAIYRKPNLSGRSPAIGCIRICCAIWSWIKPNQVWSADITYVPLHGGYAYLCAVIDWHSRYVLARELSNTLDAGF